MLPVPTCGIEDPHHLWPTNYWHFIIEPLFQTCQGGYNSHNDSAGFPENIVKKISPEEETKMYVL